jgi:VanZ family protein
VRALYYLPSVAWAALLFSLSTKSTLPPVMSLPGLDKVVHASAYAMLAALLLYGARGGRDRDPVLGRAAWACAWMASLYGVSDELHQYFVPGRSCDVFDWVADSVGAGLVVYFYLRGQRQLQSRR